MFDKIKSLVNHTLVYGVGNSGNRFVGFLLIPLYTRYLTPADYGVLSLVGLLGQILFVIMSLGQGTAVFRTYFNHDDPERRNVVITTSLWLIVLGSFPIALLTIALNKPLTVALTGKPDFGMWVLWGTLGVALKALLRLPFAVLRAREQSWRYTLWSFIQTLASLVLAIVFVAFLHRGGEGVLLSQLLAEVLVCVYLVPATVKGLSLKFSRTDAWDMLGYGAYQIPMAIFSFLLHMADRYFLKHYSSLKAVGLYSLGYRFGEVLAIAITAFSLAWYPFLFQHLKDKNAPALYARVCTYFTAAMGLLWLVISLYAKEVIAIMARPAFHEAYRVVPWIAGAFFFQALANSWSVGVILHRKVKRRPAVLAAATAVNLLLCYLLVPRYEMLGAAAAGLFSFFVWFVLQAAVAQKLYPIPYEWGRLIRLAIVGIAVYLVGNEITWGSIWFGLAGKTALIMSTPLLLYATGFFGPGELAQARRSLNLSTGLAFVRGGRK